MKAKSSLRKDWPGSAGGSPEGRSCAEFISRSSTCHNKAPTAHEAEKWKHSLLGAAEGGCQADPRSPAQGSSVAGCLSCCLLGLASFPIWVLSSFCCLSSRRRLTKLAEMLHSEHPGFCLLPTTQWNSAPGPFVTNSDLGCWVASNFWVCIYIESALLLLAGGSSAAWPSKMTPKYLICISVPQLTQQLISCKLCCCSHTLPSRSISSETCCLKYRKS